MKLAEEHGAKLHFNEKCTDANLEEGRAVFQNTSNNIHKTVSSDLLIGADGAFSAIRKKMISRSIINMNIMRLIMTTKSF